MSAERSDRGRNARAVGRWANSIGGATPVVEVLLAAVRTTARTLDTASAREANARDTATMVRAHLQAVDALRSAIAPADTDPLTELLAELDAVTAGSSVCN